MGKSFGRSLGYLLRRLFWAALAIPLAALLVWGVRMIDRNQLEMTGPVMALLFYGAVCIACLIVLYALGVSYTVRKTPSAVGLCGLALSVTLVLMLIFALALGGGALFAGARMLAFAANWPYFLELVGFSLVVGPALFLIVTAIAFAVKKKRRALAALLILYLAAAFLFLTAFEVLFLLHEASTDMLGAACSLAGLLAATAAVAVCGFPIVVKENKS